MNNLYRILLSLFFLIFASASSQADTFLGDFCWQIYKDGQPDWIYKLGVYEKEGGHYALYGTDNAGEDANPVHGNLILAGGSFKMTVVGSGTGAGEDSYEQFWTETFNGVLDASTFNGTWNSMIYSGETMDHDSGSMTYIQCP